MTQMQAKLLKWYDENKRELPWRDSPSPYQVWISEIILQQTRVNQGYDYYMRFIGKWPTVTDLAQASEEEVLKMWQGLGYYSRARNLHRCAKQIVEQYDGVFPSDFEALKKLQGIGPYTAAAIASIAFNQPCAVVDGNVYRVLSRLFDIDTPININEGQRLFAQLADTMLNREQPGLHNQAMMEFGALHCIPKNPDCTNCVLQEHCLAAAHGTVAERPVKLDKVKVSTRHFNYLVIKANGGIYLHKRSSNDIWKNLYDFPLIESKEALTVEQVIKSDEFRQIVGDNDFTIGKISPTYTHKLTHQTIIAQFIEIKLSAEMCDIQTNNLFLAHEKDVEQYPIPRLIDLYLNN